MSWVFTTYILTCVHKGGKYNNKYKDIIISRIATGYSVKPVFFLILPKEQVIKHAKEKEAMSKKAADDLKRTEEEWERKMTELAKNRYAKIRQLLSSRFFKQINFYISPDKHFSYS